MKMLIWLPVLSVAALGAWVAYGGGKSPAPVRPHPAGFPVYSKAGYDITPLSKERIDQIAKTLTPEQERVTLHADTERPFCTAMHKNHGAGTYVSVVGGLPLFRSTQKF